MNKLIRIGNQQIAVKEYKGQRVVTFKDIDLVHERPEGTALRNYNNNAKRLMAGRDYFLITGDELKDIKQNTNFVGSNARALTLITERGYLMLVKSFTDDLAWEVQGQLVDSYFAKPQKKLSALEMMELQFQATREVKAYVDEVNDDLQGFKRDLPLLGCDMDRVTTAVHRVGVKCLGGKDSNAYKDKSIRQKVYSDIYDQLKRQFGVSSYKNIKRNQCDTALQIVNSYELPMVLGEEISNTNAQMCMA